MDARRDVARAFRAARRDNAADSVTAALEREFGLSYDAAYEAAKVAIAEAAGWLRQRSSPALAGDPFLLAGEWAARLIEDFGPFEAAKPSSSPTHT